MEMPDTPLKKNSGAQIQNSIEKYPVKIKKVKIKKRYLHYLLIQKGDAMMLGKRIKGVWKGLYEFPFLEYSAKKNFEVIIISDEWKDFFSKSDYEIESISTESRGFTREDSGFMVIRSTSG